jgi:SAM-dependent methyltransferase/uncharacterized protein YbaR (Trm112 family)
MQWFLTACCNSERNLAVATVYKCLACGVSELHTHESDMLCGACGRHYPVLHGVPMLLDHFAQQPSGFHLSAVDARQICARVGITPSATNLQALAAIFTQNYHLADCALTAENNYFLSRIDVGGRRQPKRIVLHHSINERVQFEVCHHYLPRRMRPTDQMLANVRLKNTGACVLSSKGPRPVRLSYHWRNPAGKVVNWDGKRTMLPIDMAPGREMTVPMLIATPHRPGLHFLELLLVQDQIGWLDRLALLVGIELAPDAREQAPASWKISRRGHTDYATDHIAAREMVRQALLPLGRAHFTLLEIGGCCAPQLEPLALSADLYSVDIDVQTLQVGRLRDPLGPTHVHFVCADAHRLPFAEGFFDCIGMFATLHHFPRPAELLRGLKRLLKPDGFLAVMCEPVGHYFNGDSVYPRLLEELEQGINEQTFSLREYEMIFAEAGLDAVEVDVDQSAGSLKAILRPSATPVALPPRPEFNGVRREMSLVRRFARRLKGLLKAG